DALLLRHPRRPGADQAPGGGGPSLQRRGARAVPPRIGHPRPVLRHRGRQGPRRLSRGPDPPGRGAGEHRMSDRASRLAEKLPEIGADLLVVTAMVLVGPDTRTFVTDFRYVEQSSAEVDGDFDRTIAQQELMDTIPDLLPSGELRLAFEDAHMSVRSHSRLREVAPERVTLVPGGDAVEALRVVKD